MTNIGADFTTPYMRQGGNVITPPNLPSSMTLAQQHADQSMQDLDAATRGLLTEPIAAIRKNDGLLGNLPGDQTIQFLTETPPLAPDNRNGFMKWWGSESGQIARIGIFDAMMSIGAGMASVQPGSGDLSPIAAGLLSAGKAPERAQKTHDVRQFSTFIGQQIAEERAKGSNANPARMEMLLGAARNPDLYLAGQFGGRGRGGRQTPAEKAADFAAIQEVPTRKDNSDFEAAKVWFYNDLSPKVRENLVNGKQGAMRELMMKEGVFLPQIADWLTALARNGIFGGTISEQDIINFRKNVENVGANGLKPGEEDFLGGGVESKPSIGVSSYFGWPTTVGGPGLMDSLDSAWGTWNAPGNKPGQKGDPRAQ